MSIGIPKWTIVYDDLSTFDSSQGGPEQSPGGGVLAIIHSDDTTSYRVMHGGGPHFGHGFYWWESEQWFIGDISGLQMYLADPGWKVVRFGRTVTKEQWQAMWDFIDRAYGVKSSHWTKEPKR